MRTSEGPAESSGEPVENTGRRAGGSPRVRPRADNYKEDVADDFAFEEQNDNYMMYRSNSGEVPLLAPTP